MLSPRVLYSFLILLGTTLTLINSVAVDSNVLVESIPVVDVVSCTSSVLSGIRYVTHTNESNKYYECVGLGLGVEKVCVNGSVFDVTKTGCVIDEASLVSEVNNSTVSPADVTVSNTTVVVAVGDESKNLSRDVGAVVVSAPKLIQKLVKR